MTVRDFSLLVVICFIWGLNLVATRWVVADAGVPPIFFAAVRSLGVAIVLIWFLRPIPKNLGTLFLISMGMGAGHFALLYTGLETAEASSVSVVGQLGVPFSTLMSMAFLGEVVGWRRTTGIVFAFAGAALIAFNPTTFQLSYGLIFVVLAAASSSAASVLMKKTPPISAMQMQAWIGAFSFLPLFALSGLFESDRQGWSALLEGGAWVWLVAVFAVLGVSVFAHGVFYTLLKKYDVSFLTPLTLMWPIWGVLLSVILLNESLSPRLIIGAIIALGGVFIILVRQNKSMPEAALGEKVRSVKK